jgi:hypothetical protein
LNRSDLDPWVLSTNDPLSLHHRDAFMGNGLLGQRISPWGDGSAYEARSHAWRYGFWGRDDRNNEALMELPTWAVLDFRHPGPMGRPCERVLNHTQSLDLRTGTVETRHRVEGSHWAGEVCRRAWISRSEANLAVLELEIVPEKGYFIEVMERFDASWTPQAQQVSNPRHKAFPVILESARYWASGVTPMMARTESPALHADRFNPKWFRAFSPPTDLYPSPGPAPASPLRAARAPGRAGMLSGLWPSPRLNVYVHKIPRSTDSCSRNRWFHACGSSAHAAGRGG